MTKYNYFVKFFKKFNLSINSLLEKYLNKLNFNNLSNITRSNKVLLTFVVLFFLFLSYLSIPHIYSKIDIQKKLQNQLLDKYNLNFIFTKKLDYKFFPRPHFIIKDSYILNEQIKISEIKKLSVFVSLDNLFSLKNITIKSVNLENANFNLNKKNSDFFLKLFDNNFAEGNLSIKKSNIFFQNTDQEVLFMNKIINMKYYYDPKELRNIATSENEIFNIPYSLISYKDKIEKKFFSKINFNFLKLQIENELYYGNDQKKGSTNFIYNKNKSKVSYEFNKNYFNFNFLDTFVKPKFFYEGNIIFNPFYSIFMGNTDKIHMSHIFASNSFFSQLLKTEILNNKNLNIDLKINSKQTLEYQNIINVILNFKIKEGLIDIDATKFSWSDYVDFEISDSLLYVNKNQLILNGKLVLIINNYSEMYKFLQISKNSRPELKKIELDFNYNFDQQIMDLYNIKVDNKINESVNNTLNKIIIKKNKLQNKIYFKNIIKEAIIAYVG